MNKSAQKGSSTIITLIGLVFFLSSLITAVSVTTNQDMQTIISSLAYGEGAKTRLNMLQRTITQKEEEVKKEEEKEKAEKEKKEKTKKEQAASTKKSSGAIEGCGGSTSTSGCFCTTTNCYWNDSKGNTWGISKDKKIMLETVIKEKEVSQSYSQLSVLDNGNKKPLTENLVYEFYNQIQAQKQQEEAKKAQVNTTTAPKAATSPPKSTTAPSTTTTYYTVGEYYECLKNAASSSECKLSTSVSEAEKVPNKVSETVTSQTATQAEMKAQNDSSTSETTQETSVQQQTPSKNSIQTKTSTENILPETPNQPVENTSYDSCRKLGTVGQCSPLVSTTTKVTETSTPQLPLSQVNYLVSQENITPEEAIQLNPEYTQITPPGKNQIIFYTQTDPQWANTEITLPNGTTQYFYEFGCGDTVVASLTASFIDPNTTPISIYQKYFSDDENGLLGIGEVTETLEEFGFNVVEDRKSFYNFGNSLNAGYLGLMLVSFKNYEGRWIDHFTLATEFATNDEGYSNITLQDPYFGELSCSQDGNSYSCKTQKGTKIEYKFNSKYLVKYSGKK